MTLTREALLRARGQESSNGSTPHTEVRTCARCSKPLKPQQRRACSQECARLLGSFRNARKKKPTKVAASPPSAPAPLLTFDFLAALPPEFTAVETAGWRHERRV